MNGTQNIQPLLQEVETAYLSLMIENAGLKEKIADLETELQAIKDDRNQITQTLQDTQGNLEKKIADLETELQTIKDSRDQVTQTLQDTQGNLDRFYPDMQTLRDQLEQTEVETNTLSMEVAQKNTEIQQLENRIQELIKSN